MLLLFFGGFLFFFRATAWVNTGAGSETRKHRPRRELTQRLDRFLFLSFFLTISLFFFFVYFVFFVRRMFLLPSRPSLSFFSFFLVCVCV